MDRTESPPASDRERWRNSPGSNADGSKRTPSPVYSSSSPSPMYRSSEQQVKLVCENLVNAGKFDRLERFLWAIPNIEDYRNTEVVLVARSYLVFRRGYFDKLYELLQRRSYSKKYHRQLQYLWRTARYIEAEKTRGRALGSVGKYRIRRKFPLPYTIWDGECMSYCFREEARDILNSMYKRCPYPAAKEKYAIAEKAKLSVTQVSNWFKNKRQRARAKTADNKESIKVREADGMTKLKEFNKKEELIDIETPEKSSPRKPVATVQQPPPPLLKEVNPLKRKLFPAAPYPMRLPLMTKYRVYPPTPMVYKMAATPPGHFAPIIYIPRNRMFLETMVPSYRPRHSYSYESRHCTCSQCAM